MNSYKKIKTILLFGFFSLFSVGVAIADQQSIPLSIPEASAPVIIPSAPNIDAKGYVLMDVNSGYIIAEKNPDKRMAPASLTKLMTLYIIAQALKNGQIHLDDKVRISKKAWQMGGSRMFVKVGTYVPVEKLVQGIIVASGNDATLAMAQYIGGGESTFVSMMNQVASQLGMKNTHYTDSNGLPAPDHYSTPLDIAKLSRAWILNFPEYYPWFKQKWIVYDGIRQPNRNRLLWRDPSVDGMKTGHTKEAGYCLVASAKREGMRLLSVVMGAPTDSLRATESESLLNYGFRFYQTHKLYEKNTPLITPRVWFGDKSKVALGLLQSLYITIPRNQYKNIKVNMTLKDKDLKAPVIKGQICGSLSVELNGKVIDNAPLVALQNDPKGGFFSRLIDYIIWFFHKIF